MEQTYLLAIMAIIILWAVYVFNRLVMLRHVVQAAWSDIDVQLKRRHDLIPRLVEAVKAYGNFEQTVNLQVSRVRSKAQAQAGDGEDAIEHASERAADESSLSKMMLNIFALAEAYPRLKTNRSFIDLQDNLGEIEDHIQHARRHYNGAVRQLNVMIGQFPGNLVAKMFRFREAEYFEIQLATERRSPGVGF